MLNPIIIEFSLRGEWLAPSSPSSSIPSHGTNKYGSRYAYNYIQVNWDRKGGPAYKVPFLQYLLFGAPLDRYDCWGQQIYAPIDGIVVQCEDGYIENARTHLVMDCINAYKNAHFFDPTVNNIQTIAGNYVILQQAPPVFVALCHLKENSIKVRVGERVRKGDIIGCIGHSGNSFTPHLHLQLMDSLDMATAHGLSCAFEEYDVLLNHEWQRVHEGIPTNKQHIRFHKPMNPTK